MSLTTRPLAQTDHAEWEVLFQGYATFYKVEQTQAMRDTVWGWLHDPAHGSNCIVAVLDDTIIGFTHYRPFTSNLRAATNGFLDDLFVDPDTRGSGAAQALIEAVADKGRENGWGLIRWITAEDNYRARGVYDRVATRTPWVTYDIKL
ncbi:GNAT superfamily N-acetyltransferase [Sulfitobacter undariae]|uniref:GNAT superfamily N-acetyltransferase n=1 Tax=Sulfitobacter undariae TaxID=1563671 RepID=A0A7W6E160_9RHOB|nr:GNAT family N-acetyltransferase [Sulfitobacter undariae]MBB3992828.1 GNAT superfamily N-acetyltransferase [Sulfitobacter undariae]